MTKTAGLNILGMKLSVPSVNVLMENTEFARKFGLLLVVLLVLLTIFAALPNGGCPQVGKDSAHCRHSQWEQIQNWVGAVFTLLATVVPIVFVLKSKRGPHFVPGVVVGGLLWVLGVGLGRAIDPADSSLPPPAAAPTETNYTKYSTAWLTLASQMSKDLAYGLTAASVVGLAIWN